MPKYPVDMEHLVLEKCAEHLRVLKAGDLLSVRIRARQGQPSRTERYLILEDRPYGSPFVDTFNIQNGKNEVINIAWSHLQRAKVIPGSDPDPKSGT